MKKEERTYYAKKIIRELTTMVGEHIQDRQEAVLEAYIATIYSQGVSDGREQLPSSSAIKKDQRVS